MTGCPARHPWAENHDFTQPPHNTPETARPVEDDGDLCQSWADDLLCEDALGLLDQPGPWLLTVYSPATHDWVSLAACDSCARLLLWTAEGPAGGVPGVAAATRRGGLPPGIKMPP